MAACAVFPPRGCARSSTTLRPRVIWNRQRAVSHAFTWAPALEFLEYGGTVTLRVAKEAPRAHESTAALPADMALFERLKELRLKFAKRAGVPAFVIFTDATLRAMSAQKPRTMAEFLKVPGVGGKGRRLRQSVFGTDRGGKLTWKAVRRCRTQPGNCC